MKPFVLLLVSLVIFSCSEKTIQLPETTNQDIVDVKDVSSIYMFYNMEQDSLEFNRKNMISTTNWLVAIDKRLRLEQILPQLIYLQDKRLGDGVHQNKDAGNYFACSNTRIKNLSFIEFTNVIFSGQPIEDFKGNGDEKTEPLMVNFKSKDSVELDSKFAQTSVGKNELNKTLKMLSEENQVRFKLFLSFNGQLTFQNYVEYKTLLLDVKNKNIELSRHEFIYN